jgi:hypothetical protein
MNVGHQSAARLCLPILLLAGCGSVPDQRSELDATIERYYEVHASEPTDACLAPYIDAIRATQVVEDEPARLVVEVRYRYLGDQIGIGVLVQAMQSHGAAVPTIAQACAAGTPQSQATRHA